MIPFPTKKYGVVYADPCWSATPLPVPRINRSTGATYYETMSDDEIFALPVASMAEENCALFLWVTNPQLETGIKTVSAWGFRYVTVAFVWVKLNEHVYTPFVGMGSYTRSNAEIVLLGVKGTMPVATHDVQQIVMATIGEHSAKPDDVRRRIERLYPDSARIELFARERIKGWDAWGNETEKYTEPLAQLFD